MNYRGLRYALRKVQKWLVSFHIICFDSTRPFTFLVFFTKKNMKNWNDWWEYNCNNIFSYSEHLIPSQRVGSIIKSVIFKNVLRSAFFTEQCIMTMGRRESSAPQSGVVLLFPAFHKRSLTIENHNSREMRFISCRKCQTINVLIQKHLIKSEIRIQK